MPDPSAGGRSRARELVCVVLAALLVAIAWTWPLARELSTALPFDARFTPSARGSDTHQYVWNLWWTGEALSSGRDPFTCPLIFHPRGHSLALHTHAFADGVLAWPLRAWLGLPAAFNATLIGLLAASLAATYALGRALRVGIGPSALLAFGWACSPYFAQKSLEHLSYAAHPWAPLLWLGLVCWRSSEEPARRRLWALVAGVAAGLAVLTDPVGGAWTLLLGALLVVGGLRPPTQASSIDAAPASRFGGAWIAVCACLLVCAPYLRALVNELADLARASGPDLLGRGQLYHARLADFATPPGLHPLSSGLGAGAPLVGAAWGGARPETSSLYLGAALCALAAYAWLGQRATRRLLWIALVLFALCWDPGPDPEGWLSALYRRVPGLDALRVPSRGFACLHLVLAVAAAHGAAQVCARRAGAWILAGAGALCAFEWWHVPPTLAPWRVPAAVESIARLASRGAVCVLPFRPGAYESMSWQTVHGKPVTWSYVARTNPAAIEAWRRDAPGLFAFALGEATPQPSSLAGELARLDVEHVLVPLDELADPRLVTDVLDQLPGWKREADDGVVGWWRRE